ncbi:uncharacterized protein [Panulirus ornatus]|uniref:uncharacterized protein isoform X1 n=1 Tax=Panulirus ornatus TaxID=150431 RepID=UPI003A8C36E2
MSVLEPYEIPEEDESDGWCPPPDPLGRSYLATVPGYSLSTWEELCSDVNDPYTLPQYNIDDATCGPQELQLTRLEPSEEYTSFPQTQQPHLVTKQAQSTGIQILPNLSQGQQGMEQIQQSSVHSYPNFLQQPSVVQTQQTSTEPTPGNAYTAVHLSRGGPYPSQLHPTAPYHAAFHSGPSDLNTHLQVGFLNVFWDQPNNRTPRHLLRWFGAIYNAVLQWSYFCHTLIVCPFAVCCWGCCFGCISFMDVWICRPILMLVKSITTMMVLVLQEVHNTFIYPLVKSCGLVLSRVHITHIQIHTTLGRHFFHRDWE